MNRQAIPELLTPEEAAKILKVSLRIMYKIVRRGLIPYYDAYPNKNSNRLNIEWVRFRREDLSDYLDGRYKPPVYQREKKPAQKVVKFVPLKSLIKKEGRGKKRKIG